jgi:hypothetical protein
MSIDLYGKGESPTSALPAFIQRGLLILLQLLAEKGGSRTLREPYDPQTGFEDQRRHRTASFSIDDIFAGP